MEPTAPRSRGRAQLLDADEVVSVALRLLDAEGANAVSIRRLSADLGVSHMTLYGYFESKDALLEAMVARTLDVPSIARDPERSWDENLTAAIREIYETLVARPGIAEMLVAREFGGAWIGSVRDKLLSLLVDATYDESSRIDNISVLFNYLLGAVMIDTNRTRGGSNASFEMGLEILVSGIRDRAPRRSER